MPLPNANCLVHITQWGNKNSIAQAENAVGPCQATKRLTSSIVRRGTSFHHAVEREFPPIAFDLHGSHRFKRIGLEAGPLSQWLYSALAEAELPVICVETRSSAGRDSNGRRGSPVPTTKPRLRSPRPSFLANRPFNAALSSMA
jgi:hypothetical protein